MNKPKQVHQREKCDARGALIHQKFSMIIVKHENQPCSNQELPKSNKNEIRDNKLNHVQENRVNKTDVIKAHNGNNIKTNREIKVNVNEKESIQSSTDKTNKSRGKTPESLQVRELKKIEDYWTRKSPVSEQSPRLRSSSKFHTANQTSDEIKHNISCTEEVCVLIQNLDKSIVNQMNPNRVETSLPESPVPRRISQRLKINELKNTNQPQSESCNEILDIEGNVLKVNQNDINKQTLRACRVTKDSDKQTQSPGQHPKITTLRKEQKDRVKAYIDQETECKTAQGGVNTRSRSVKQETLAQSTAGEETLQSENKIVSNVETIEQSLEHENMTTNVPIKYSSVLEELSTKEFTESDSEDDEDYIPPRKKLRSEVTRDELWEGFPLTFSFKRLAPIRKQDSSDFSDSVDNVPSTSTVKTYRDDSNKRYFREDPTYEQNRKINSNTSKECVSLKSILQSDANDKSLDEKRMTKYLGNNMPWLRNRQIRVMVENVKQQGTTLVQDSNTKFLPITPENPRLPTEHTPQSSTEKSKQGSSKKRKHNISPSVILKRSTRLLGKQGQSPVQATDVQSIPPRSVEPKETEGKPSSSTDTSSLRETCDSALTAKAINSTDDKEAYEDRNETINCEKDTHKYNEYTKLKAIDKKDMSILEILTHDFGEQISSTTANTVVVEETDNEIMNNETIDVDTTDLSISQTDSIDDKMTRESVSETLTNLFKTAPSSKAIPAVHILNNNSNTDTSQLTEISCPKVNNTILPSDDNDRSLRSESVKTGTSADSPTHTCNPNRVRHKSSEVAKLKLVKGANDTYYSCSSASDTDSQLTDSTESINMKRKVPPLRIKLKPKISNQKKKKSKETKEGHKTTTIAIASTANVSDEKKERNNTKSKKTSTDQTKQDKTESKKQEKKGDTQNKKKSKPASKRKKQ